MDPKTVGPLQVRRGKQSQETNSDPSDHPPQAVGPGKLIGQGFEIPLEHLRLHQTWGEAD